MATLFLYANGRVAALDKDILPVRMWQMLIAAKDAEEVHRLLAGTWYGAFLSQGDFEVCFELATQATEQELVDLSEEPGLVRGILHRRDARNARYIWKAALAGARPPFDLSLERPGLVPLDLLSAAIADPEARLLLPPLFQQVLTGILALDEPTVRAIDTAMDHLAARVELEELPGMGPGFAEFLKARFDYLNFLTAGRASLAGIAPGVLSRMLLQGASREPDEIIQALSEGRLPALLAETCQFEKLGPVLKTALSDRSFLEFEREGERALMGMIELGSFAIFGPAPLASFVLKREMEISHLRILLAAKASGMDRARLLKRLPRG
jgi:vacuolar-type H+-ATPase subunit C/Vma6